MSTPAILLSFFSLVDFLGLFVAIVLHFCIRRVNRRINASAKEEDLAVFERPLPLQLRFYALAAWGIPNAEAFNEGLPHPKADVRAVVDKFNTVARQRLIRYSKIPVGLLSFAVPLALINWMIICGRNSTRDEKFALNCIVITLFLLKLLVSVFAVIMTHSLLKSTSAQLAKHFPSLDIAVRWDFWLLYLSILFHWGSPIFIPLKLVIKEKRSSTV